MIKKQFYFFSFKLPYKKWKKKKKADTNCQYMVKSKFDFYKKEKDVFEVLF